MEVSIVIHNVFPYVYCSGVIDMYVTLTAVD